MKVFFLILYLSNTYISFSLSQEFEADYAFESDRELVSVLVRPGIYEGPIKLIGYVDFVGDCEPDFQNIHKAVAQPVDVTICNSIQKELMDKVMYRERYTTLEKLH